MFGIVIVGWAIAAWIFLNSEIGQRLVNTAQEAAQLYEEGARGPGTDALNDLGCEPGLATTMGRVLDVGRTLFPDLDPAEIPAETPFVVCQRTRSGEEFSCENVARVWGEATGTSDEFVVVVSSDGQQEGCGGVYDHEGNYLRDFELEQPEGGPEIEF